MADSKTITINLKAVSDFNDVLSNAKQIQTALSKIKVPENLKGTFDKIFSDIEKHSTKAAEAVNNGFKTKGDISNFQKNINGINTAYDKLYQTITKIDGTKLGFGSYEGEIKSLSAQIEGLQTKMANFANTYSKAVKEATVPPSGSKSQAWGQFAEAFETKDIEAAEKALHKLNLAMGKASEGNKGAYAQKIEILTEALKALKGESPEVIKDAEELQKKLSLLGELQAKGIKETAEGMEDIASNAYGAAQGAKQFGESAEQAAEQTQHINSEMDHFKQRIAYFFGAQNAVNLFKRALQSAFSTVKDLDAVMTETAVVTKFDVGDMWTQLPEYTKRANELGVSIHSAYEAATIYYQQGLETNQVMEVSNQTLKMARIAGLDAAEATDRMTNALRGFNMEINEMNAERVADVYSKLAAMSASNVDEISTAMTKVASLASNANMEFETTAAFLAQMIETTRESAETAGTALKTVIARFSEVKSLYSKGELLGTDEEGEAIDVNKVSKALRSVGVDLNEYLTGMKGLDDIFIELASKWDSLDQIQQRYIATMAAGSRQQSRFIAMMQDYARTQELVSAAETANGASQEQYQKTLESLETKLNRLKNAWDEFVMSIANSKFIKGAVDLLTGFITAINKLTSSLPGALNGIAKLGLAFGAFKIGKNIFNKGLADIGQKIMGKTTEIGYEGGQNLTKSFSAGFKENIDSFKNLKKPFQTSLQKALDIKDVSSSITNVQKQIDDTINAIAPGTQLEHAYDGTIESLQNIKTEMQSMGMPTEFLETHFKTAAQNATAMGDAINTVSTSMMTAGGLFIMIGQILSSLSGNTKGVSKAFTAMGTSMLLVGMTLKVLKNYVMDLGITTGLAGKIARDGWGWIGLVLTIAAALIGLVISLASSIETASQKADRLANNAKEAANAAEEAAQRYEDLKKALDELKDSEDSLDNLVVGTQAWKDAVMQVNKQVLELLRLYPKLAPYITSENGVLGIDVEGAKEVIEEYNQAVIKAQKGALYGNAVASKADIDSKRQNLKDEGIVEKSLTNKGLINDHYIDLLAKALNGNSKAIEEVESITGKNNLFEGISPEDEGFNNYVSRLAASMGLAVTATDDNVDALRNYGQAILVNEAEMDALFPALVDSKVANEEYADSVKNFLSSNFLSDQLAKEANRKYENFTESEKKEYEKYFNDLYGEDFKGVTSKGEVELTDKTIKKDAAMSQFAGSKADEIVDPIVDEFVNNIANQKDEVSKAITEFYGKGKGANLTEEQFSTLLGTDLKEYLTGKGFVEGTDEYNQIVADIQEGMQQTWDAIKNRDIKAQELGMESAEGLDKFSGSALNSFFSNVEEAMQESGPEVGAKMKELVDAAMEGLNDEDARKFGDALAMIDWNDINSVERLPEILEDLDLDGKIAEGALVDLENSIIEFTNATRFANAELLANTVKQTNKILGEIKNGTADRSFTKDEYTALTSLIPGIEKQFTMDGEDNWIYLGNSMEDLKAAIEENTSAQMSDTQATLESMVQGADVAQNVLGQFNLGENTDLTTLSPSMGKDFLQYFQSQMGSATDLLGISGFSSGMNVLELDEDQIANILASIQALIENRDENQVGLDVLETAKGPESIYNSMEDSQTRDNLVRQSVMGEATTNGMSAEEVINFSNALQQQNENLRTNQELADIVALANSKMNQGLSELIDSYKDWTPLIDESGKLIKSTSAEDTAAINKFKASVNKMLNTTEDLSDAFYDNVENMENIKKAAEGDTKALGALQKAAADDYLVQIQTELDGDAYDAVEDFRDYLANTELPELEPGVDMSQVWDGAGEFIDAFNQMVSTANFSAEQIQEAARRMGFDAEVIYVTQTRKLPRYSQTEKKTENPDGTTTIESGTPVITGYDYVTGEFPVVKTLTSIGSGGGGVSVGNQNAGAGNRSSGGGGGGGGGGGKEEKPTYWENPYDELYNLTEKINEALRERERLERRYQKIAKLSTTTAQDMRQAFTDQIAQLQKEIELQRQLEQGRLRQIKNVGSQIYTDKEGNRSTFSQLGVTKYASYDEKTGLIQIDWDAIEAVSKDPNRSEEGEAIEAYISKLEELVEGYEEIRDTIWDMEDEIEDLAQQAIESYLDFEDRVYDALVEEREREIEAYKALSDAIQDSVSRVIDKMQQQIEEERQARENDKTEQEIADKEARLAYLSRDTSGANQMEVMKLQQEIDDARQNYTDSLIDQAIQEMQKDADKAAEQREQQISLLEAQLKWDEENGVLRKLAQDLILDGDAKNALGNQKLVELLKATDGYKGMSYFGQENWENDFVEAWNKAQAAYEAAEAAKKQKEKSAANVGGNASSSNNSGSGSSSATTNNSTTPQTTWNTIVAAYNKINQGAWGNGVEHRVEMGKKEGFSEQSVRKAQQLIDYTYPTYLGGYGYSWDYAKKLLGYKTGGLADFTGPAWLDGTRSHPEMVLNAADTENLIMLKDILGSILKRSSEAFGTAASELNFDIDINADLSSDYDVEQLADKVKGIIYDEAMYKNVNTVNRLR